MKISRLILPPSGLAVPKSAAPEPTPQPAENPLDRGQIQERIEQAGRGLFQAMKAFEAEADVLVVASLIADVQAYLAEAQRDLLETALG